MDLNERDLGVRDDHGQGVEGEPAAAGHRSRWRFAGHYLEMVVAMLAGMLVLGTAFHAILGAAGADYSRADHPAFGLLEMACTMSVGMAAWMRYRGHGWVATLEMTVAMFVPLVVLLPLLWAGIASGGTVMMPLHVLMPAAMLIAMFRRRDEYGMAHERGRRIVRVVGRGLAGLLAFALVPGIVFIANSRDYEASLYGRPATTTAAATPPAYDPGKPTVAVVVDDDGVNVADALVSYEVLASAGAFNVYTVAPERRPVPLLGGLDMVPDFTFAQLAQRLGGAAPDVIVVPAMSDSGTADHGAVTAWLRESGRRGLLLSVCAGARVAAEAGLLDGHAATSHWYWISGLEADHPAVRWQRGIRYVDDGNVISTGGLLSGVDGALRVVERLAGADAAAATARTVGWRYYSPGAAATLPRSKLTVNDALLHTLNLGFRWGAPTMGVVLTNGVGEIELAAAFDPYAEHSLAARTLAVAAGGGTIRSRHGLTFVPRADLRDIKGRVDRLLVPGAADRSPDIAEAARRAGVPVKYLNQSPGFAFDETLRDMAATMDVPSARWAAKVLEYPADGLGLSGPGWPWTLILRPLALGLSGLAVASIATRLVRHARTR